MQLTKAQRRNLELYASYHLTPPTFWNLFRQNMVRYLLIAALILLLFLLAPTTQFQSVALVASGLFLGALLRDISRFWQFVRLWPATSAILDWKQLDALLNNSDRTQLENSPD